MVTVQSASTTALGTEERPLRVAIIGAGPSGFYAAGALLQNKEMTVAVDMFDRLPAPHGLVRYGVAPDHEKIKSVSKLYDRTAALPQFRFFGHVNFGTDIVLDDLCRHYDQIVFAVGAQTDRSLEIPGEELANSMSATEFVAWYNSHPDYVDLDVDLSCKAAVVVGVGNVAMDVARILAKSVEELEETDIADYALEKLADSHIRDIYVLARRGPAQAKFTPPEIKEFGELAIAEPIVHADELALDAASAASIADDRIAQRNMEALAEFAEREPEGKPRRVHFLFLRSPVEIIGQDGKVAAVRIEKNKLVPTDSGYINAEGTGEYDTLDAGLVLRAVGYRGVALPGVPFNERRGTIPNQEGRIVEADTSTPVSRLYVVGWAKRGPTGIIGTNKPDAVETVEHMLEDVATIAPAPDPDPSAMERLLAERGVHCVSIDDWKKVDAHEVALGQERGKPRVKFCTIQDMLDVISTTQEPA